MVKTIQRTLLRFQRDDCSLHASALTYYTLIAIVPLLALLFGLAKGFDLDALAETYIRQQFSQYDVITKEVIQFSRNLIDQTKSGVIAGIGIVVLIWSGVKLLSNIESSFNHIWGIEKGRPWARKLTDFIAVALLSPFLFIASNALFSLILRYAIELTDKLPPITKWGLYLLPLFATAILIFLLLRLMPSVKVSFKSAALAAIFTALILHLFQAIYFNFQSLINSYGAVYGSFAAFPLFLIWLQTSWMIILFGAELSRTLSDPSDETYKTEELSSHKERLVALTLLRIILTRFRKGDATFAEELKKETLYPLPAIHQGIERLKKAKLIAESELGLVPLKESDKLTLLEALSQLELTPNGTAFLANDPLEKRFIEISRGLERSSLNTPLIDIY